MRKSAKTKPAPMQPAAEERLSLVVAFAYCHASAIALAHIAHGGFRVIPDFDKLCDAEACLSGALEIVIAAKDRAREKL